MSENLKNNRRKFLKTGTAGLAAGMLASEVAAQTATAPGSANNKANISSFRTQNWNDHFSTTAGGAILVDLASYALHFWNDDRSVYRLYPTANPLEEELTRRGTTTIVRKKVGPSWAPTESMLKRNPDLPRYVGPGPENPLGTHGLYLGWQYYLIHGNNDQRKIGRAASNGCIGLFNEHIAELYDLAQVGCQVKIM